MKQKLSNPVHNILLDMLEFFHTTCVELNLNYYAVGGTMLGAKRHNGFIPWDDDIDIAMPRKDYEILIREFNSRFGKSKYALEYPSEQNPEYTYLYAKLYDTDTTLVEQARKPIKRGVYLDIFPLDGIGDNLEEAKLNYSPILKRIRWHYWFVCSYTKYKVFSKKVLVFLARIINVLFVSERKLNNRINSMCKQRDFYKSEYVGNLLGAWAYKEIVRREYLGKPTEYDFCGITIYGVEKPHEYLSSIYGDYMKLPPEEKRVSHHDYINIDLNKSYCNY